MSRPRYLGHFAGGPVFRLDRVEDGRRVWRRWVETNTDKPFEPGVYLESFGMTVRLCGTTDEQCLRVSGRTLDEACSTPRLARVLRAMAEPRTPSQATGGAS